MTLCSTPTVGGTINLNPILYSPNRDRNTSKNDFVFYANRMCRLVVEAGLGQLPFKEKTVTTPAGEGNVARGGKEGG